MAYWFLEKESGKARIFGSISAICANTEFKKDALYWHFSRQKKSEFENDKYRIVKTNLIRGSNSNGC